LTKKRKTKSTSLYPGEAFPFEEIQSKIDSSNLKADFDFWPLLAKRAWTNSEVPTFESKKFDRVIFSGLGGSGLTGELLVDISKEKESNVTFETLKDYHIPRSVDKNRTLLVGMSSSGNTEETLSILSEAHKNGMTAFSFGSGGLIETFSKQKWNFGFVRTQMLKVPRSSLPGIFYPVLKFLTTSKLLEVSDSEALESIKALELARNDFLDEGKSGKNKMVIMAKELTGSNSSIPLIYSSNRTRAVGLRFRQSINENAKMHAFNGEIPELCHNEIVAWDYNPTYVKANSRIIRKKITVDNVATLLRLKEDDPEEINARFDIVRGVIDQAGGKTLEAPYTGSSYLARIMAMLYLLDYVTYFMAILNEVDPIKTPSIQILKEELGRKLNYLEKL
jgi:glucose/mannose-6-phosphate isomerase